MDLSSSLRVKAFVRSAAFYLLLCRAAVYGRAGNTTPCQRELISTSITIPMGLFRLLGFDNIGLEIWIEMVRDELFIDTTE